MFYITSFRGDEVQGEFEADGRIEFVDHRIGSFTSRHVQGGHFFSATISIWFDGEDPLATAGLNDPELTQVLGFRGKVEVQWQDPVHAPTPYSRLVRLSYEMTVLGEDTSAAETRRNALLDLDAINAFLDRAIYAYLHSAPHTAESETPLTMS